jgi:hypothetical protein
MSHDTNSHALARKISPRGSVVAVWFWESSIDNVHLEDTRLRRISARGTAGDDVTADIEYATTAWGIDGAVLPVKIVEVIQFLLRGDFLDGRLIGWASPGDRARSCSQSEDLLVAESADIDGINLLEPREFVDQLQERQARLNFTSGPRYSKATRHWL